MNIYRIEHPTTGKGFWNDNSFENLSFKEELRIKHKQLLTPQKEGFDIYSNRDYVCAFKTIEDLLYWMNKEWLNELIQLGFNIYKIKINKYFIGLQQIIYNPKDILNSKIINKEIQILINPDNMKKQLMLKLQELGCEPRYQGTTKTIWVNHLPDSPTTNRVEESGFNILISI